MNEIKLKHCPFCGGSAVIMDVSGKYYIVCTTCATTMPNFVTSTAAAKAWNKRIGHETYKEYLDDHISWDAFPNATTHDICNYMCISHFFGNDAKAEDCGNIECSDCWDREMS